MECIATLSATENLTKAATLSESLFHLANHDFTVQITRAFLKIENIHQYEALFIADMKDFLSEKIRDVYKKAHSIKSEFNCADFYISFKFMPYTNMLNFDSIQSDRFTLEYNSDEEKKGN